mmetsp:Transcript_11465/g.37903  ORF Transcript_11465/g.37903 Transcript_11465/m.37903 type:complete len:266 (+) Transcript_11465:68-865(+)
MRGWAGERTRTHSPLEHPPPNHASMLTLVSRGESASSPCARLGHRTTSVSEAVSAAEISAPPWRSGLWHDLGGLALVALHECHLAIVHLIAAAVVGRRLDELRIVLENPLLEEHRPVLGERDEEHQHRDADDHAAKVDHAHVRPEGTLEEDVGRNDGAEVASSAHHAGNDAERGAGDVGHDAKVEALRHLHKDGEEDYNDHRLHELAGVAHALVIAIVAHDNLLQVGGQLLQGRHAQTARGIKVGAADAGVVDAGGGARLDPGRV